MGGEAKFEVDVADGKSGVLHVAPGTGVFAFVGHASADAGAGVLALYDCKSGEYMVRHEVSDDAPTGVAAAYDSAKAAFGTRSGKVFIWDVAFPAVLECFNTDFLPGQAEQADAGNGATPSTEPDIEDAVTGLCWHPRGHALAVAHESGRTTVWDMCLGAPAWSTTARTHAELQVENSHTHTPQAWTANGRALLVASGPKIEVWDARRGKRTAEVGEDEGAHITSMDAFEDMSRVAVVGRKDGSAELTVLKVGENDVGVFADLPRHEAQVVDARIAPLSTLPPMRCATAGGNAVHLFDMQDKKECGRFEHAQVRNIAFATDGRTIFSAGGTLVNAWDASGGACESIDVGSQVTYFSLADHDTHLIVGCADGKLRCYDIRFPARTLGEVQ